MVRTLEDIKAVVAKHEITPTELAKACDPPLDVTTVWRVLEGKRSPLGRTQEALSAGLDRVIADREAEARRILNPAATATAGEG